MSAVSSTNEALFSVATETTKLPKVSIVEPLSDHSLLEATREGHEAAFAELVRRYRNQITNYVYRMVSDYETAVDIAQETFLRVYRAADRYHTSYAFSTYIYRIATNLAISELRRRKRRRLISLTYFFHSHEGQSQNLELDPSDNCPLQDTTLVEDERRNAVARAIATLPEKYRAPLILRDVEGLCYDDIAKILKLSVGTVKSRINRGRAFLRDKLQAYI